jgi:hypothetical protein
MHTIGGPPLESMHCHPRIVVGFIDPVLGTGSLFITPLQQADECLHARDSMNSQSFFNQFLEA